LGFLVLLFRKEWEAAIAAKRAGSGKPAAKKLKKGPSELNNKSTKLSGLQRDLADSGTRRYVDSDSD
jgi:hypothetical protein